MRITLRDSWNPLKLYRVAVHGGDWVTHWYVRAEDPGKAVRYVRNRDQEFYNTTRVTFSVTVQDEAKGVVFG